MTISPARKVNFQLMGNRFWPITARRQSERDLNASEARYRRLFETATDGILLLDAESGEITDLNPFMGLFA
jgi:PAS domain-containing protein